MGLEVKGWTRVLMVTTQEQRRKREGGVLALSDSCIHSLALILCLATLHFSSSQWPHFFPNLDPPSFYLGTLDTNL